MQNRKQLFKKLNVSTNGKVNKQAGIANIGCFVEQITQKKWFWLKVIYFLRDKSGFLSKRDHISFGLGALNGSFYT